METCVFWVGSTSRPHCNSPLVAFGLKLRILNTFLPRSKEIPERGRDRFVFCIAIHQIAKIRLMTDLIGDCDSVWWSHPVTSEPASVLRPAAAVPQKASLRSLAVHDPSTCLHALPYASMPILRKGQGTGNSWQEIPRVQSLRGNSGMSAWTSVMLEIRVSLDIKLIWLTCSPMSLVWGSRDLEVEPKPIPFFFF